MRGRLLQQIHTILYFTADNYHLKLLSQTRVCLQAAKLSGAVTLTL